MFMPVAPAAPQQIDARLFSAMRWRLIGPFRGGRVTAVAGIPGQPAVYYMGTPGGGVWKTTDGGRVWKPIFDRERVASIGALAIAESDPRIVYVGTGEQTAGNGVYKSADGGATWQNIGLANTHYIQAVLVDPRNPNIVIVGATGDFSPGPERGVFKSTDGGNTWKKVLYKDDTTGVVDLCFDPDNPHTLYAALSRRVSGPAARGTPSYSGIFRSTDEGSTWKPLDGKGLPPKDMGRIGIAVAPGNHGRRVYAICTQGFFRSDDSGVTWQRSTADPRILGSGYFSRIFVDPRNADTIYVAQTSLYRSTDGGHTFEPFRGAPGGDDYHVLWIDPQDSARMILGVDQGAIISVDGGRTWSSWYNQATGQFYHVSTDNAFPYRVYGQQQDSGTAGVASRSDYGEITSRDWYPVGGFENGYIAADPTNANIVYSGGWYGSVVRFDKVTAQVATVFVAGTKYRTAAAAPLIFSPQDPHTLYFGTQFLLKTSDAGMHWQSISPDLTQVPASNAGAKSSNPNGPRSGTITTLSPSPLESGEIWVGTGNGRVQLTRDGGGTWRDVSPTGLPPRAGIQIIDASHHDAGTAYVAGGSTREATTAYIARTHDYGQTWQKIVAGLPDSEGVRVVREDPSRKGLLYAGTVSGVFVSFDDGDHWQSLQLNLPTATVTDLAIHGSDLVASTFGRALWILDDLSPLRQMDDRIAGSTASLLLPETVWRLHWDNNPDTPLPPETPAGQNPPDGAILNYYLKSAPAGDITLTVIDEQGKAVRRFSSKPQPEDLPLPNVPSYWFAPPEALPKNPGMNRFVWNLRYPSPLALPYSYYGQMLKYTEYTLADDAIPGETPRRQPLGPFVLPGNYTVELNVDGQTYRQPLSIKLDPRVPASASDLAEQLDLENQITIGMAVSYDTFHQVEELRTALSERQKNLAGAVKEAVDAAKALDRKLEQIESGTHTTPGLGPVNRDLTRYATAIQSADARPSETAHAAVEESCKALDDNLAQWRQLNSQDLPRFNSMLEQRKIPALPVIAAVSPTAGCHR